MSCLSARSIWVQSFHWNKPAHECEGLPYPNPRAERKGRYRWQSVRHRKAVFNTAARFPSPESPARGASRVPMKPQKPADILQEKRRYSISNKAEERRVEGGRSVGGVRGTFIFRIKSAALNRNATHSSSEIEKRVRMSRGGNRASESVAARLLSLFRLPASHSGLRGPEKVPVEKEFRGARKTRAGTFLPSQTPRWFPDVRWIAGIAFNADEFTEGWFKMTGELRGLRQTGLDMRCVAVSSCQHSETAKSTYFLKSLRSVDLLVKVFAEIFCDKFKNKLALLINSKFWECWGNRKLT